MKIKWFYNPMSYMILYTFLCTGFIVYSWYSINDYSQDQLNYNIYALPSSKNYHEPFSIFKIDSSRNALEKSDIRSINNQLAYFNEKLNTEVLRAQTNTQYDIDRINTFLAIGIGLLAVIGGLLPIGINFISKEQLVRQIENLESTVALQKSSVEQTETKVEDALKKVPMITSLALQTAVSRLLTLYNIRYYAEPGRNQKVANILSNINDAVHECKNEKFDNCDSIVATIGDLKIGLQFSPLRAAFSRESQELIDDYGIFLDEFTTKNIEKFPDLFKEAHNKLSKIIDSLS